MAKYTGKTVTVDLPASQISEKFADLTVLEQFKDRIPAEQREKVGEVRFEKDGIVLNNPQTGEMAFRVTERTDKKVVFHADGMIPLNVYVDLKSVSDTTTEVTTTLDIDIPLMLRPIIGGKLQQVADMFGEMIGKIVAGKTDISDIQQDETVGE